MHVINNGIPFHFTDTGEERFCISRLTPVLRQGGPRVYNMKQRRKPALASSTLVRPFTLYGFSQHLHLLTDVLRSGRRTELHLCTSAAYMQVRFADGQTLSLGLGPAHDSSRYEYGMNNQLF